jgi:iron-sulfur cluster repair protein YtfE (RIC family)
MKTTKRHESLIPLSREHHYALMLCLRINRGLPDHGGDAGWLQSKARQTILFFESDLVTHFKAEEEILFPAMRGIAPAAALISELHDEHRKLEGFVQQLRSAETDLTEVTLGEFAGLLEAHIRKEERLLFPLFENEIPGPTAQQVGRAIQAVIGMASKPQHPELFEP